MMYKNLKTLFFLIIIAIFLSSCKMSSSIHNLKLIEFKDFNDPKKHNSYLICPLDYCDNSVVDEYSDSFRMTKLKFKSIFLDVIANSKRTKLLKYERNHYQFIQKSMIFGFPDIIDIKFLIFNGQVTFIIYSRSIYGFFDFNVNRNRVKNWLLKVNSEIEKGLN